MKEDSENKIEDTEAGLEGEFVGHHTTEEVQDVFVDDETALRIEFQKAVENAAEERASTPFQVAAMTHARMCGPALEEIDRISGGAARRILKYLIAYPFFVKELNAQDRQVEHLAQVCDKLVHTKFTMAMCQAIEKQIRVDKAIQEQEDLIQDVPDDLPEFGTLKREENE